jgi:putative N6-adenine-specific DNA methylase
MIPKNIERRIRQHVYAKQNEFFAIVQPGFENTALKEMNDICGNLSDAKIIEGGIVFNANARDIWKLNYSSRLLTRLLMRIGHFKALYFNELSKKTASLPWELYLNPGHALNFSIKCRHSKLYHTERIEDECLKGINSRMKEAYANHEEILLDKNKQTVYIRLEDDVCTVSLDTTGEPLYRRGFRRHITEAPMRETLASCILYEAEAWKFDAVLDPMCGSGVIPIEAALLSLGIPPGIRRKFVFEEWPGHSIKGFEYIKKIIKEKLKTNAPAFAVFASDISDRAIETARYNADISGLSDKITIKKTDFFSHKRNDFPGSRLLIVFNPPYGERINLNDIKKFYKQIAVKLKKDFPDSAYAVILPSQILETDIGLSPDKKIFFRNGGLKVALLTGKV